MRKLLLICIFAAAAINLAALEITIDDYVDLVLKNSKQLIAAAKDLDIAGATEKAARSQALPTIGASAGYTRNLINTTQTVPVGVIVDGTPGFKQIETMDIDMNITENDFSFGLGLNQQIFNLRIFHAIRASRQYRLLSSYVFDAQRDAIVNAAKKIYYQNYLLEKLLAVRKNVESNTYENYLNAQDKFEAGIISEFDFLRAEVEWKTRIPETLQSQRNLDIARVNLKNLAGISADKEVVLISTLDEYPPIPEIAPLSDVLASRPDYKASVAELTLREINLRAARADHFPTVSGNIAFAVSAASDTFSIDNTTRVTQVGITASVPIFTGGALSAQSRRAQLEHEQSAVRLQQMREDVAANMSGIHLTLRETHQRILTAEATLAIARRAYDIAQTSYRAGMATQLDLKDVTTSYELANINYISAVYEYLAAYFDWEQAMGKSTR